jgi:hypothetical protein
MRGYIGLKKWLTTETLLLLLLGIDLYCADSEILLVEQLDYWKYFTRDTSDYLK